MKFLKSNLNYLLPLKVKKMIRMGRDFDGGYIVCADTLKKCKNLISLGVGDDTSFERDFDKINNSKKIFLYDFSINFGLFFWIILKYLRRLLTFRGSFSSFTYSIKNFINFKDFISQRNVKLFKEKVVGEIKKENEISLNKIFHRINDEKNSLLKVDIEGDEYKIIDQVLKHQNKILMLIIEFHWIKKNKKIFEKSVKKLNKCFQIIHLHANNYKTTRKNDEFFDVVEISFINKRNYPYHKKSYRYKFPIFGLDYECFPNRQKINFSFQKNIK
tara:strand:+ start:20 stop:838 length:819 start_codon:yes stop_codon:yes gene_type:complete